ASGPHSVVGVAADLSPTHGRQEAHFIAGTQGRVPGSEFAIACGDQRRAEFAQLRPRCRTPRKQIFDQRSVPHFDNFFRSAGKLFQSAKIEHFYDHWDSLVYFNPNLSKRLLPRRVANDSSSLAYT